MAEPRRRLDKRASDYLRSVLNKDRKSAEAIVREMVSAGTPLVEIYEVMGAAQVEVGDLWEKGIITVSDEHFATKVTEDCVSMASGRLRRFVRKPLGRAVLCTVEGEFHILGLKMMCELMKSEGWEAKILDSTSLNSTRGSSGGDIDLLCGSATMPANVPGLIDLLKKLRADPAFKKAKILVGGPAFRTSQGEVAPVGASGEVYVVNYVAQSMRDALDYCMSAGRRAGVLHRPT
jgi:methanogenic corrinoid protein MtbC1